METLEFEHIEDIKLTKANVTIGVFDGLHKGHIHILNQMLTEKDPDTSTVIITFQHHPIKLLEKGNIAYILSFQERLDILKTLGVDIVVVIKNRETLETRAVDFVKKVRKIAVDIKIFVGKDFRFGKNAQGDINLLLDLSEKLGFGVEIFEKIHIDGMEVSSTRIRDLLSEGDVVTANKLLGYEFFIEGEVIRGERMGTKIGFPTINVAYPEEKVRLKEGVYVVKVKKGEGEYKGVAFVGIPTIGNKNYYLVETYILEEHAQILYGDYVRIKFLEWIRGKKNFYNIEEARKEIEKDIKIAREKAL